MLWPKAWFSSKISVIALPVVSEDETPLTKLHVRHYMTMHGFNTRKNAVEIKKRLIFEEEAELAIFSVGFFISNFSTLSLQYSISTR